LFNFFVESGSLAQKHSVVNITQPLDSTPTGGKEQLSSISVPSSSSSDGRKHNPAECFSKRPHLKAFEKKNVFNNFQTVKLSMDCCNNLHVAGSRAFTCPAPLFFSRWWPGNGLPLKKVLSTMPGDFTSVWYNWASPFAKPED